MPDQRKGIRITTLVLGSLIALLALGGGLWVAFNPPPPPERQPARVEYRIFNTAAQATVEFLNDEGAVERHAITQPGSYRFRAGSGQALSLHVKRVSPVGAVGCLILVDGRVTQSIAAEAERGEALCSGQVP